MRSSAAGALIAWLLVALLTVVWPDPFLLLLTLAVAVTFTVLVVAHLTVFTMRVAGSLKGPSTGRPLERREFAGTLAKVGLAACGAALFGRASGAVQTAFAAASCEECRKDCRNRCETMPPGKMKAACLARCDQGHDCAAAGLCPPTAAFAAKRRQLKDSGLDLGAPVEQPQYVEYGGWFQAYQYGRIYWRNGVTYEVHGGILTKYLQVGGPGVNPQTAQRDLGFPVTDELRTADDLYPVSYFEWGAIYWINGGASIHGTIYQEWKKQGAERAKVGYPVTDHVAVAGGEAVYCERGCLWMGPASNGAVITSFLTPPLLGRPQLINPTSSAGRRFAQLLHWWVSLETRNAIEQKHSDFFTRVWRDRLVLQRVVARGQAVEEIPLDDESTTFRSDGPVNVILRVREGIPVTLRDRCLYNIGLRLPNSTTGTPSSAAAPKTSGPSAAAAAQQASPPAYVLAPHAFYAKMSWDNFGFMHATDLHVSRRLEDFRPKLRALARTDSTLALGAKEYNNFNDGLRYLIRYANQLHDRGQLDFILATGDLVDYQFEHDDSRLGGGNFAFFERLIRGQAPTSEEGVPNEELRVPIFTVLGNHDYRPNPYTLLFYVDIPIVKDRTIEQFGPHNLTWLEARALQGGKPTISRDDARRMVAVGTPTYYFERINPKSSYLIELGRHRIVMLDSKWDIGIQEDDWDGILYLLGLASEDQENFAAGEPNSEGFTGEHVELTRLALQQTAGTQGLVVVGVHAPPFNPKGKEYAHFFRETEHPRLALANREVERYLRRQMPLQFRDADGSPRDPSAILPDWVRTATSHFKRGGIGDLLDWGISQGETEKFLELCSGKSQRPVDLVLCGHGHRNAEFRLKNAAAGGFLFYFDFYAENPSAYYATPNSFWDVRQDGQDATGKWRMVWVEMPDHHIVVDANVNAPVERRGPAPDYWELRVPAYAGPLSTTGDARAWWTRHRPLVLQTAGVGPIDASQRDKRSPVFQGFRTVTVQNNVMTKIHYVTLAELPHSSGAITTPPPKGGAITTPPPSGGAITTPPPSGGIAGGK